MEPLQILYIMLGGVGAIFLLISIFGGDADGVDLDGDIDISDIDVGVDGPSIFSMKILSTFALVFGIAGTVVFQTGGSMWAQIIWGVVLGLAVSTLYLLIMRLMYGQQASSMGTAYALIGKVGRVTIATTDTGKGQITVSSTVGMTDYFCIEKGGKKLKQNDQVTVVSVLDPGTLLVESI
jgi:membrane protein implicated in regulation of membrane protease activity